MYKKTSLLLLTLLSIVSLYAQNINENTLQKSIELQWSESSNAENAVLESDFAKAAEFKGAAYELETHNFPIFTICSQNDFLRTIFFQPTQKNCPILRRNASSRSHIDAVRVDDAGGNSRLRS